MSNIYKNIKYIFYQNTTFLKPTRMYSANTETNIQGLRKESNGFIIITQFTDRL